MNDILLVLSILFFSYFSFALNICDVLNEANVTPALSGIQPNNFNLPDSVAINDKNFEIELYKKEQRCAQWELDSKPTNNAFIEIGKDRQVIIITDNKEDDDVIVELKPIHKKDVLYRLQLTNDYGVTSNAYKENKHSITFSLLATKEFYIKLLPKKATSEKSTKYILTITIGEIKRIYNINIQNHHYESSKSAAKIRTTTKSSTKKRYVNKNTALMRS